MIGYPFITFIYPLEFKAKKAYYKNLYSLLRTTYVAGWIGRCNFFYRHSLQPLPPPPPPSTPYGRLSYVVIIVGTIDDCIWGVQNVCVLKKRQSPPFIVY